VLICGTPHPQPLTAIREKLGDMVFDVPQMSKEEAKKFRDQSARHPVDRPAVSFLQKRG
jgi:hypothetical protein